MSLSAQTIQVVKATAPVVGVNALKITSDFYPRMFHNNPETLAFFNKANQLKGAQQNALAAAVVAYATNIEDLTPVVPALPRIIHKHVALDVKPEHYQIVAKNLMESIGHVLGDAVTPEIAAAWQEAVGFLAALLIGKEKELATEVAERSNGWEGYRKFRIANKTMMSEDCCKFRFEPVDGDKSPFDFKAGQYLSVRVPSETPDEIVAPRHYTVVSKPGEPFLECCIKALKGGEVSNRMHRLEQGTVVTLAPPVGVDLVPRPGSAVIIGGGIGITPIVALAKVLPTDTLKAIIQVDRAASPDAAPFHQFFKEGPAKDVYHYVHSAAGPEGHGQTLANVLERAGTIDVSGKTHYYICGPNAFMDAVETALTANGAPATHVHTERFGPADADAPKTQLQCPFKPADAPKTHLECPFKHYATN